MQRVVGVLVVGLPRVLEPRAEGVHALHHAVEEPLRVPVPTGSLTDFTANLKTKASVEDINAAFAKAAKSAALKGVLKYTEDPIVSSDIVTDPHSSIFDAGMTMSMGKLVKVSSWYDNEWGYSNRLVDMTMFVGSKVKR